MTIVWLVLGLLTAPPQQDAGSRAFQRCAACHALGPGQEDLAGPGLQGVVGRRAGSLPGFAYSDAMRAAGRAGLVWDRPTLERYLVDPEAVVPGTTMPFQGGPAGERAAVIDFLQRRR